MQDRTLRITNADGTTREITLHPSATVELIKSGVASVLSAPTVPVTNGNREGSQFDHWPLTADEIKALTPEQVAKLTPWERKQLGGGELHTQIFTGGWARVDANSNLLNADGSKFTKPTPTDPLPQDYGDGTIEDQIAQAMQWQVDHPSYKPQFYVDGPNKFGQPGTEPGAYFTTAGGKLRPEAGRVPLVDVLVLPPVPSGAQGYELAWPAKEKGITMMRTTGWGAGPLNVRIKVPADWTKPFSFRLAEIPLTTVTKRGGVVRVNDKVVLDEADGPTTSPMYRFGPDGTPFAGGDTIDLAFTNPGLPAGQTADAMLELTALG